MDKRKPTPTPPASDFSEDDYTPVEVPPRMSVVPAPTDDDEVDPDAPLWEQVLHAVRAQGRTLAAMQATQNVMYEMLQNIVPRLSSLEQQMMKRALEESKPTEAAEAAEVPPSEDFPPDSPP